MLQCSSCKKYYSNTYALRRHYLTYLPYYFGSHICIPCERRFESKAKLIKHLIKHNDGLTSQEYVDISHKRQTYFEKKENHYLGIGSNQFDDSDIDHLVGRKFTTDLDIYPTNAHLLSIEQPKVVKEQSEGMDLSSRIVTTYIYKEVNVNPSTSFENNLLRNGNITFPNPPFLKRKYISPAASSFFQENDKLVRIENHIKKIESKLISKEQSIKTEIQSAKEEILQKLDQSIKYDQQLFSVMSEMLKLEIKESLDKMLSGALLATRGQAK